MSNITHWRLGILITLQVLHRDVEEHNSDVDSAFNLCNMLLPDTDSCLSETEKSNIEQIRKNLDKRWRSIRARIIDRRHRLVNTLNHKRNAHRFADVIF